MNDDAMTQVTAQRRALADRARLPWWFWVLFTAATVGLLGGPLFTQWLGPTYGTWLVQVPAILVFGLAERLVRRSRGIHLSSRTFSDYPSCRVPGIALLVVAVVGIAGVLVLHHSAPAAAVVVLLVCSALAVGAMVALQRAILGDVRAGRVRHL